MIYAWQQSGCGNLSHRTRRQKRENVHLFRTGGSNIFGLVRKITISYLKQWCMVLTWAASWSPQSRWSGHSATPPSPATSSQVVRSQVTSHRCMSQVCMSQVTSHRCMSHVCMAQAFISCHVIRGHKSQVTSHRSEVCACQSIHASHHHDTSEVTRVTDQRVHVTGQR
jgi:hypothetical protein